MADAVAPTAASSFHENITAEDVHTALARLRSEEGASVFASVLTLVVVAHDPTTAQRAASMIRDLRVWRPSRVIILQLDGENGDGPLDAAISVQGELRAERRTWFEEIVLTVRGRARWHLDSVIGPFTRPDLPVVAWWPTTLPSPGDPLLDLADRILVDTREVEQRSDLLAAVERLARRLPVADLAWARLHPWRSTLAALFEGPDCRPFLDQVTEVQVSGSFGGRHLMGGWLMSRLGLPTDRVTVGDSRHVRVRVYAEHDGRAGRFGVERDPAARRLRASIDVEDGPNLVDLVDLPPRWAPRSLIDPLRHTGPDLVYGPALQGAVELAQAAVPISR